MSSNKFDSRLNNSGVIPIEKIPIPKPKEVPHSVFRNISEALKFIKEYLDSIGEKEVEVVIYAHDKREDKCEFCGQKIKYACFLVPKSLYNSMLCFVPNEETLKRNLEILHEIKVIKVGRECLRHFSSVLGLTEEQIEEYLKLYEKFMRLCRKKKVGVIELIELKRVRNLRRAIEFLKKVNEGSLVKEYQKCKDLIIKVFELLEKDEVKKLVPKMLSSVEQTFLDYIRENFEINFYVLTEKQYKFLERIYSKLRNYRRFEEVVKSDKILLKTTINEIENLTALYEPFRKGEFTPIDTIDRIVFLSLVKLRDREVVNGSGRKTKLLDYLNYVVGVFSDMYERIKEGKTLTERQRSWILFVSKELIKLYQEAYREVRGSKSISKSTVGKEVVSRIEGDRILLNNIIRELNLILKLCSYTAHGMPVEDVSGVREVYLDVAWWIVSKRRLWDWLYNSRNAFIDMSRRIGRNNKGLSERQREWILKVSKVLVGMLTKGYWRYRKKVEKLKKVESLNP